VKDLVCASGLDKSQLPLPGDMMKVNWRVNDMLTRNGPFTYGKLLQMFGGLMRTCLAPDIWVRCCLDNPEHMGRSLLIEDCRFPNEQAEVQKRGGVVIKLQRDEKLISKELLAGRDRNDPTETGVDDLKSDVTIVNNGSVQALEQALLGTLQKAGIVKKQQ
jgi:hypothetical protein